MPTLWLESRALRAAQAVSGVETIVDELVVPAAESVDELVVPAAESDDELAGRVGTAIATYPYYTMWDHVEGRVVRGVVMLAGSVAPGRDKVDDLLHRIAKVPGVPPFHILVNNGRVTLRGLIRNEPEKRTLEQLVRQTCGVLDVINELGTGW